jgi:hypothetical protein
MSGGASLSFAVSTADPGLAGAPGEVRARYLLACFHERHVPLTPALAQGLALLEAARRPSSVAPWGRVFTPMGQVLGMAGRFGHSPAVMKDAGLFHTQVAEPLLRRAASRIGSVVLLGPADWSSQTGRSVDYGTYCRQIETALAEAIDDPAEMGEGFWAGAGLALLAAARGAAPTTAPPDPRIAKLAFAIDPAFPPEARRDFEDRRPKSRSDRDRSGTRPKEGGVKGIIQTTRVEDFGDAALSEFMQPREILLNKLLHEGYLMRHRPPKRTPRRDLLVLTARAETGPVAGPADALYAAAWADFALRGQILLRAMEMVHSDLVHAGLCGGLGRLAHLDVATAPALPDIHPLSLTGDPRRLALTRSGLAEPLVARSGTDLPGGDEDMPLPGLRAALDHLRRGRSDLDPALYARRVVIECLTEDETGAERDFAEARAAHAAALGLAGPDAIRLARIVLPARLLPGARLLWTHGTFGQTQAQVDLPEEEDGAAGVLLGTLSLWMLQSMREVLDGAA